MYYLNYAGLYDGCVCWRIAHVRRIEMNSVQWSVTQCDRPELRCIYARTSHIKFGSSQPSGPTSGEMTQQADDLYLLILKSSSLNGRKLLHVKRPLQLLYNFCFRQFSLNTRVSQ
jgi:hypothetical protein